MWEWRVFGPPEVVPVPARLVGARGETEVREDVYLLLLGEGERPRDDAGLKVRQGKCELKLRLERDRVSGAERWEKVFDPRLPLEGRWVAELLVHLGARVPRGAPAATADELAAACAASGVECRSVVVKKRVAKAPCAPAYALEASDLCLPARDGSGETLLRSVAIEAPTLEICLALGALVGLREASRAEGAFVGGYPGVLGRL